MQVTYDFQAEIAEIKSMTVRLDDGRVLRVSDNGSLALLGMDGEQLGESHVDFFPI